MGWLRRAQGGSGRASGAPSVDLGLLVPASRNDRMKVTSDLQVPGPTAEAGTRHQWLQQPTGPALAPAPVAGYLRRQKRAARLSWAKAAWRYDLRAWARLFLPARARRPGWLVTRRSAGAVPSRNGRPSFAARARARPVPGILKAWHIPNCDGPTSRPPRKRPYRLMG